ncbi:MAG TPA: hypothetical protein VMC81_12035 [Rhodocyclaceae bacterium]|nr:hypothetical protein [Rhodocyclaceae bacterium]
MLFKKVDIHNKEGRQFVVWAVGTLSMPLGAMPFIYSAMPDLQFDLPTTLVLCVCWGVVSLLLRRYIKENLD